MNDKMNNTKLNKQHTVTMIPTDFNIQYTAGIKTILFGKEQRSSELERKQKHKTVIKIVNFEKKKVI